MIYSLTSRSTFSLDRPLWSQRLSAQLLHDPPSLVVLKMPLLLRTSSQQSDTWFIPLKKKRRYPASNLEDQDAICGKSSCLKPLAMPASQITLITPDRKLNVLTDEKGAIHSSRTPQPNPTSMQMPFLPCRARKQIEKNILVDWGTFSHPHTMLSSTPFANNPNVQTISRDLVTHHHATPQGSTQSGTRSTTLPTTLRWPPPADH